MVSLLRVQVYPVALVEGILHIEVQTDEQAVRMARHGDVIREWLRSAYAATHPDGIIGFACDVAAPIAVTS